MFEPIGPSDREQPVPRIHLHLIPREGDIRLAREHGPACQAARRHQAGSDMRDHRRGREAPRDGLHQDRREALRGRPRRHRAIPGRHDEEEDRDAGSPDVRRE